MFKSIGSDKDLVEEKKVLEFLEKNSRICHELVLNELNFQDIHKYKHKTDLAVKELGLDDDLINQLTEEYVKQIIKSKTFFLKYLKKLKEEKAHNEKLDYTELRELAHKNLGVARNLRIEDAKILLYELMTKDDIEHLDTCLKALVACAVKLKPKLAYDTIKLNGDD